MGLVRVKVIKYRSAAHPGSIFLQTGGSSNGKAASNTSVKRGSGTRAQQGASRPTARRQKVLDALSLYLDLTMFAVQSARV